MVYTSRARTARANIVKGLLETVRERSAPRPPNNNDQGFHPLPWPYTRARTHRSPGTPSSRL
jgi:hypothetical protein